MEEEGRRRVLASESEASGCETRACMPRTVSMPGSAAADPERKGRRQAGSARSRRGARRRRQLRLQGRAKRAGWTRATRRAGAGRLEEENAVERAASEVGQSVTRAGNEVFKGRVREGEDEDAPPELTVAEYADASGLATRSEKSSYESWVPDAGVTATPSALGRPVMSVGAAAAPGVVMEVVLERGAKREGGKEVSEASPESKERGRAYRAVVVGVGVVVVVRREVVGVVTTAAAPPRPRVETLVQSTSESASVSGRLR